MLEFRNANLKFNQDDIGMTSHKTISTLKNFIFRAGRSEGPVIFILIFSSEDMVFSHSWVLSPVSSISNQDSMTLSTPLPKSPKLSKDKSTLTNWQDKNCSTIIWVLPQDPTELLMNYSSSSSQLKLLTKLSLSLNTVPTLTKINWRVWILTLQKMTKECLIYWASPKRDQEDIDLIE